MFIDNLFSRVSQIVYGTLWLLTYWSNKNFYFLGFELKIQPSSTLDLIVGWILSGNNSCKDRQTFYQLIDIVADNNYQSFDEFQLMLAAKGLKFNKQLSNAAEKYILKTAYLRGQSYLICKEIKNHLCLKQL